MSEKLAKIKLFSINGETIVAPRSATSGEIKQWYEQTEEIEADRINLLSLTARPDATEKRPRCYAEIIESREFDPATDLPMFL